MSRGGSGSSKWGVWRVMYWLFQLLVPCRAQWAGVHLSHALTASYSCSSYHHL